MKRIFGYARVSSCGQNCARQVVALKKAGVPTDNIFVDHKSGKDFDRPEWKRLKAKLRKGDLLIMQTLDRFGRSYDEVIAEWQTLVNDSGIDIKILDFDILDTTRGVSNLTGRLLFDIVLRLLSYLAETERCNIKERQRQGIAVAKSKGVKFGRPRIKRTAKVERVLGCVKSGDMSIDEAAMRCDASTSTIRRWLAV